jgi:hypothetical protein
VPFYIRWVSHSSHDSVTDCTRLSIHRLSAGERANAVRSDEEVMFTVLSSSYDLRISPFCLVTRSRRLTFIRISEYLSLCCSNSELVEPTMYDFVPTSAKTSNCCRGVYGPNKLPFNWESSGYRNNTCTDALTLPKIWRGNPMNANTTASVINKL